MPHDEFGEELKVGDSIVIPARITELHLTEEYCNLTAQSLRVMFPSENRTTFCLNAKQVRKVK